MEPIQPSESPVERTDSHLPRLGVAEWAVFALLAALLAVINIYSTLLIGWGDTGSIIAVLGSVALLGAVTRRQISIQAINLGQTMASAGGSVGFAVSFYAALKLVDPTFDPNPVALTAMFAGVGLVGTIIGASVRTYMVRYYFPSGTACAVIQKTVTAAGSAEARRPLRLMALWGAVAGAVAVGTSISLKKGGAALIKASWFQYDKIGVAPDPLYYGIGIVVGPRVGIGLLIGGIIPLLGLPQLLAGLEIPAESAGDWQRWFAISVLTLPTFATILFAYVFRTPAIVPPGFSPGAVRYAPPRTRNVLFVALATAGLALVAVTAQGLFDLPFHLTILTAALAWPLCVMNGRVAGETDINPVRLVAIVLLTAFAYLVAGNVVALLGIAIIGGSLAAMAVDMMQDYRTGYLINANHSHQTSVQFVGTVVGALVAVPFILLLDHQLGFGPETSLPAPGSQVWAAVAQAFTGGFEFTRPLVIAVVAVSLGGAGYAFLTVWPKSAALMPSIFGIGIGMLLPFSSCAAIFVGGMIKWAVSVAYRKGKKGDEREDAGQRAGNDTLLIGASIFAAAAVVSVLLIILTTLLGWSGLDLFHLAGH
jgi:uncharacterized oligopeptide transporter (OPT) family protein